MTDNFDLPDWIYMGAQVAVPIRTGYNKTAYAAGTVTRITPTQIVVSYMHHGESEMRFRAKDRCAVGGTYTDELRKLTDRHVVETMNRQRVSNARAKLDTLARGLTDQYGNLDAEKWLEEAVALLQRVQKNIRTARNSIVDN